MKSLLLNLISFGIMYIVTVNLIIYITMITLNAVLNTLFIN